MTMRRLPCSFGELAIFPGIFFHHNLVVLWDFNIPLSKTRIRARAFLPCLVRRQELRVTKFLTLGKLSVAPPPPPCRQKCQIFSHSSGCARSGQRYVSSLLTSVLKLSEQSPNYGNVDRKILRHRFPSIPRSKHCSGPERNTNFVAKLQHSMIAICCLSHSENTADTLKYSSARSGFANLNSEGSVVVQRCAILMRILCEERTSLGGAGA